MTHTDLSDTDLALRLARALGWQTPQNHSCRDEDGDPQPRCRCPFGFRYPAEGDYIMPRHLRQLLSGDGMLRVLDAMRERGWKYNTADEHEKHSANVWRFTDSTELQIHSAWHDSLPRAVAEAAYLALTGGSGDDA